MCPNCGADNPQQHHFCQNCGGPLTAHAATDPLGQVFAGGFAIRKASSRPGSRLVLIGMWLIFGSLTVMNLPAVMQSFQALVGPVLSSGSESSTPRPFPGEFARFKSLPEPSGASYSTPHALPFRLFLFLLTLIVETIFIAILVKVTWNYSHGRQNEKPHTM